MEEAKREADLVADSLEEEEEVVKGTNRETESWLSE